MIGLEGNHSPLLCKLQVTKEIDAFRWGWFGTKECIFMLEYLSSIPYPSSNGKQKN